MDPSGIYVAPALTACSLKIAGLGFFRNMGELIYYFLSVNKAAYIWLTRGAARKVNFVLAAFNSPCFII